jgi:hypothetical protein
MHCRQAGWQHAAELTAGSCTLHACYTMHSDVHGYMHSGGVCSLLFRSMQMTLKTGIVCSMPCGIHLAMRRPG